MILLLENLSILVKLVVSIDVFHSFFFFLIFKEYFHTENMEYKWYGMIFVYQQFFCTLDIAVKLLCQDLETGNRSKVALGISAGTPG